MDLVFEIGTEELPAGFQKPALEWMAAEINRALDEARLNGEGEGQRANISTYATPRRLALIVTAIAAKAPDVRRQLSGPPAKQAMQDGKWTKAAEGFARKAGVSLDALKIEGDRVVVEQHVRGQTAAEALPPILEATIRGIPFRKSMRWDWLETDAFARPVHWIGATLDGKPLPVKFADVASADKTRGHRFAAPQEFPLPAAKDYVSALRKAHVLADWAERSKRIAEEVARGAREASGVPRPDPDLLETVTGLVEEPFAVTGTFDKEFLQLPPEVLISEMRGHQKYFAVENDRGELLPAFVAISNTKVRDPAVSRRGYERVLRAPLRRQVLPGRGPQGPAALAPGEAGPADVPAGPRDRARPGPAPARARALAARRDRPRRSPPAGGGGRAVQDGSHHRDGGRVPRVARHHGPRLRAALRRRARGRGCHLRALPAARRRGPAALRRPGSAAGNGRQAGPARRPVRVGQGAHRHGRPVRPAPRRPRAVARHACPGVPLRRGRSAAGSAEAARQGRRQSPRAHLAVPARAPGSAPEADGAARFHPGCPAYRGARPDRPGKAPGGVADRAREEPGAVRGHRCGVQAHRQHPRPGAAEGDRAGRLPPEPVQGPRREGPRRRPRSKPRSRLDGAGGEGGLPGRVRGAR